MENDFLVLKGYSSKPSSPPSKIFNFGKVSSFSNEEKRSVKKRLHTLDRIGIEQQQDSFDDLIFERMSTPIKTGRQIMSAGKDGQLYQSQKIVKTKYVTLNGYFLLKKSHQEFPKKVLNVNISGWSDSSS